MNFDSEDLSQWYNGKIWKESWIVNMENTPDSSDLLYIMAPWPFGQEHPKAHQPPWSIPRGVRVWKPTLPSWMLWPPVARISTSSGVIWSYFFDIRNSAIKNKVHLSWSEQASIASCRSSLNSRTLLTVIFSALGLPRNFFSAVPTSQEKETHFGN